MKKIDKQPYVEDLAKGLTTATSIVFVNYAGLSVKMQQELKNRLATVGAHMVVVKNTLLKRAGTNAKLPEETLTDTVLSGQTALITSDSDPVAPLQILGKFATEFVSVAGQPVPQMKAGIIEGLFQEKDGLVRLSKLPGREVLYAQVVGAVASPMYGLVGTLQGNIQKLFYVLNAKAKA